MGIEKPTNVPRVYDVLVEAVVEQDHLVTNASLV